MYASDDYSRSSLIDSNALAATTVSYPFEGLRIGFLFPRKLCPDNLILLTHSSVLQEQQERLSIPTESEELWQGSVFP
ncbi:unnamed protein product [Protopolystoma xenopodis]|uniref:Uncharacterized protein n=1 Tax=Protopolystoma xenopodis TaxID=117903 RepID=A0A448XKH7_9PLAT|nr:unnamed protein product [Protopolystoma xenopodis]